MYFPATRRLIFSNSTPKDLINLSEVCKDWYQDAHIPLVVQNVIYCFDRALGAQSPVLCEPEHCWEELLRRRWIQAWVEEPIFSEPSLLHRSGYIEDATLPETKNGQYVVLNKNPNYPNLIGIFTSNVSFSLFDRKGQLITKLKRPKDKEFWFDPWQYEGEFNLHSPKQELFTDRMLVVKTNGNQDLCCILFDSKKKHSILGIHDFNAYEDCVITVDHNCVFRDFTISQEGRIDHGFIDLNQAIHQYPEFHGFEIKNVRFINAKLEKRSCIVAIQLTSGNQQILLFLTINCRNNYEIERLGHHSIENFEFISCHVDPTVNRIMVHDEDGGRIGRIHLIDYKKKKIHQFCDQSPLLEGTFPTYHNGCLAILADLQTVQLWRFVEEEDGFKPFLLRTFTVASHPHPEINNANLKLFRTGFAIILDASKPWSGEHTVHTYHLLYPSSQPEEAEKQGCCTIQ